MAAPVPTKLDATGRIVEMHAAPAFRFDIAFDSSLILHEGGTDNHTLTLVLKIHLNEVAPMSLRLPGIGQLTLPFADHDGTLFAIKAWTPADSAAFKKKFLAQCAMWTNEFWLIPPPTFSLLDVKVGTRTVRPNLYCHLFVALVGSPAGAHRSIDVVNLDRRSAARQLGKRVADLNASDFRSDAGLYDSLDVRPVPRPFQDETGATRRLNRSTFAHEIGHALGLDHSGVNHGAPACHLAVVADTFLPTVVTSSPSFPAVLRGASNSDACYGQSGPLNVGANIMGFGAQFDATNAQPWLDRIALHTGTRAADWRVSVKRRISPKVV